MATNSLDSKPDGADDLPSKLTIDWLVRRVPLGWWLSLLAFATTALASVFSAGMWFADQRFRETKPQIVDREQTAVTSVYEWQWAGENWYGRLTFAEEQGRAVIKAARIGELRKRYIDGNERRFYFDMGPLVAELVEGSVDRSADTLSLRLLFDKRIPGEPRAARQLVSGSLRRRSCFAGQVTYQDFGAKRSLPGDMILVDYLSMRDEGVDGWFASPAPSWEELTRTSEQPNKQLERTVGSPK